MKSLWKRIKRFFGGDYSKPVQSYDSHDSNPNNPTFKPRWGFIIPHTNNRPGAVGYKPSGRKINEYNYGIELAVETRFKYETRDKGGVYGAAKKLKDISMVNATIEPHKNAFNGKAHGFELLVLKGDSLSGHYARMIAEEFKRNFPERRLRNDNGIKWVKKGDRGANNLIQAKKAGMEVAILSETFFLDNPDEWISTGRMAEFWEEVLV